MGDIAAIITRFWPFVLILAFMYFFMYRPQKKRQNERDAFLKSLRKGDEIITFGGMYGIIKAIRDKYVELEIAHKIIVRVDKQGIAQFSNSKKKNNIKEKPVESVEVVEEIIEVDNPEEVGTEVIEEVEEHNSQSKKEESK